MGSLIRGFYSLSEWIMRLAYVNLFWILFTIFGVILLGFFPATTAMFTVVQKWVRKQPDNPVFKTFWITYKSQFLRSNLLGLIIIRFCEL